MSKAVADPERSRRVGLRVLLIAGMRYVLLRPGLKKPVMHLLKFAPGLLMAAKRFGVRAGLAQDMGDRPISRHLGHSGLARQGRLSVRGAEIHAELRSAMLGQRDE
ncbi:hypothetical protein [Luteimonas sp. TWI1437]|uniref:hypothetical protein n=1 Tax=unclassified Luteimonas TaxID=2629088 RepID=UPI003208F104